MRMRSGGGDVVDCMASSRELLSWQVLESQTAFRLHSDSPSHQSPLNVLKCPEVRRGWAVRTVLADDHPIVLRGLTALLQARPGLEIIAAVQDGATALETIRTHEPDIALLDISMPQLTGLGVLEAIEADGLSTRVIILSTGSIFWPALRAAVSPQVLPPHCCRSVSVR